MRHLIVNADDFGLSAGVTRGILEAHQRGIVTSASLMVDAPDAEEAARLARAVPSLSIGLHAEVAARPPCAGSLGTRPIRAQGGLQGRRAQDGGVAREAAERCRAELERQLDRFRRLLGRAPTHLDSHHNAHRLSELAPTFVEAANRWQIPLREHSAARYLSKFYGRWGGESHPEQISLPGLLRLLTTEGAGGLTELACHPGYADAPSGYRLERELELRTLCAPALREALSSQGIELCSYHDYPRLVAEERRRDEGRPLLAPRGQVS